MHRELDVAVVEPDDHAERDHVVAHRVDERAAELAVASRRARSGQPIVWMTRSSGFGDLPDLLHAERPDLRVLALRGRSGRARRRSGGPASPRRGSVTRASDVRARLEVRRAPRRRGRGPCRRCGRRRRGRPRRAASSAAVSGRIVAPSLLGLLGEPAAELRERGDVVAVVPHRRRRRDPQRALAASGSRRASCSTAPEERHRPSRTRPAKSRRSERGLTTAPESRCEPGCLPFSSTATGTSPSRSAELRVAPRAAGRAGSRTRARPGPAPTIEDADLDPLVRRIGRRGDDLRRPKRRREVGRAASSSSCAARTSSVSFGTISCRSPTTPRSANSKIGAFGSLLIATIVPEPCMPTLCWIAPEMPQAT